MDLKEVLVVLKKCGMLILGAIGVATINVPKFNCTSSKFSKKLCWLGILWFHPIFHCIAHQHERNNGKHCPKWYRYFHPILFQLANPLLKHMVQVP